MRAFDCNYGLGSGSFVMSKSFRPPDGDRMLSSISLGFGIAFVLVMVRSVFAR